jgi:hypothetical protein
VPGALFTFEQMHLHPHQLYAGQGVIYKGEVIFLKIPTVHEASVGGFGYQYPWSGYWFPNLTNLSPSPCKAQQAPQMNFWHD